MPIGIGFPKYRAEDKRFSLGDKCRLFAEDESTLQDYNARQRLSRLNAKAQFNSIEIC